MQPSLPDASSLVNFTCRSRTFQLSPAEAALALHRQIAPELRERSGERPPAGPPRAHPQIEGSPP